MYYFAINVDLGLFCDLHALRRAPDRPILGTTNGLVRPDPHVIGLALCEAPDHLRYNGCSSDSYCFVSRSKCLALAILDLIVVCLGALTPFDSHFVCGTIGYRANSRSSSQNYYIFKIENVIRKSL